MMAPRLIGSGSDANQSSAPLQGALPDVSEKSTKADIMKAYKTIVKKYEDNVQGKRSDQAKKSVEEATVKRAGEYTVDAVVKQIESVKLEVANTLNVLSQKLVGESKKLSEIQEAHAIEEKKLKDLYDVEAAAVSLEDLFKAQAVKKEEFEASYEQMKQARKRDEEEYEYAQQQRRKKEDIERKEREEAHRRREDELKEREQELVELRKKVESFPAELDRTVQKVKEETSASVKREAQIQADLILRETEGKSNVMQTRITFLEETIARQNEQLASLKTELVSANKQVQEIAEKAIEGQSGKQTLKAMSDIAMQQASRPGQDRRP